MTLSRRDFLGAAAVAAVAPWLMPRGAVKATAPAAGGPFLPYGSGSYFQSPAASQAVDPVLTASFRAFMAAFPGQAGTAYPVIRGTAGNTWGTPYALGQATDPVWTLAGPVNSRTALLASQGFHAPAWLGDVLTGTSDSPFCVQDTASGFTVFGGRASVAAPGVIRVGTVPGITWHSSNGLDWRNPASGDIRNQTSRGRISDAMVIRRDLMDWAIANGTDLGHVLHLFLAETDSSAGFQSPMVGCEGGKHGWGAEGQRLAIDASVDLTARGLSPAGYVIALTLQNHGCYVGDNSGSVTGIHAEQETPAHPVWGGELAKDSLAGITWDDFVALVPA